MLQNDCAYWWWRVDWEMFPPASSRLVTLLILIVTVSPGTVPLPVAHKVIFNCSRCTLTIDVYCNKSEKYSDRLVKTLIGKRVQREL